MDLFRFARVPSLFSRPEPLSPFGSTPKTRRNGYALEIEGGRMRPDGYVIMQHGKNYQVVMTNSNHTKCQASLTIDGEHIGNFLINPYQTIHVERPLHRNRKFTFYKSGTHQGNQSGIVSGAYNNGVVEVIFTPAMPDMFKDVVTYKTYICQNSNSSTQLGRKAKQRGYGSSFTDCEESTPELSFGAAAMSFQEGGTGLSGRSGQQFRSAPELELDNMSSVSLSVRLVSEPSFTSFGTPEPLSPFRRPVKVSPPPPVGFKEISIPEGGWDYIDDDDYIL